MGNGPPTMRILGGTLKGRRLAAPRGLATRPMIARAREALFNILAPRIEDARVADLYSGTGSLGLEALSRGAAHVDFFEKAGPALRALRQNIATLGCEGRCVVHARALPDAITRGPAWDLVLLDPPWCQELGPPPILRTLEAQRLAPEGLFMLDERYGHGGEDEVWAGRGLEVFDRRRYGDSGLLFLRPLDLSAPFG